MAFLRERGREGEREREGGSDRESSLWRIEEVGEETGHTGAQTPPTTLVSVSTTQPLQSMLCVVVSADLVMTQPRHAGW
jgi:hypothetical protein